MLSYIGVTVLERFCQPRNRPRIADLAKRRCRLTTDAGVAVLERSDQTVHRIFARALPRDDPEAWSARRCPLERWMKDDDGRADEDGAGLEEGPNEDGERSHAHLSC